MGAAADEAVVRAVLLRLWGGRRRTVGELAQAIKTNERAVRRAITSLNARGCELEVSPAGAELRAVGLACWSDVIESQSERAGRRIGRRALVFQRTTSTNDVCWRAASDRASDGLVALADEQSAGRGRRGGAWVARAGQSVLMSILLRDMPAVSTESLTLQVGLAAAEALEGFLPEEPTIKWPNDIQVEGRKLAGILVEARPARGAGERRQHLVLGIGVNVLQRSQDFPPKLRGRSTSVAMATGQAAERLAVVEALLSTIERRCLGGEPAAVWVPAWKARCGMLGRIIRVRRGNDEVEGRVLDVDPLEGLVLQDVAGVRHVLPAQSTTVVNP